MKRMWTAAMAVLALGAIGWQPTALAAGDGPPGDVCAEETCRRDLECAFVYDPFLEATVDCNECDGDLTQPGNCDLFGGGGQT